MPPFLGVIFDVDGTLVDSNDAHAHAWVEVITEQGYSVDYATVRQLIGMGSDKLLPKAINIEVESPPGEKMAERRGEVFKERYLASIEGFSQARALVERLSAEGLKLVVASSAKSDELEPLLQRAEVADLLTERISSSDAKHSKPAPDTVELALDQLDLPPTAVVMIGDTPYDIAAATQAGVGIIALRCGGWDDEALAGALAVYDDPADLLAHFDTSPLGVADIQ
jgi:HAD superfamily hydrolase (TIGR01549 family)